MKGIINRSNVYLKPVVQEKNRGASLFEEKIAANLLERKRLPGAGGEAGKKRHNFRLKVYQVPSWIN